MTSNNNPTLRDQFAMAGLQAIVQDAASLDRGHYAGYTSKQLALEAYELADALLAARGTPESDDVFKFSLEEKVYVIYRNTVLSAKIQERRQRFSGIRYELFYLENDDYMEYRTYDEANIYRTESEARRAMEKHNVNI